MSSRFFSPAVASVLCATSAVAVFASGCDSATNACDANQTLTADGCYTPSAPSGVRSSTVGYLTTGRKRATALSAQAPFQVRRADDQSVVFEGMTGPDVVAADTSEVVHFVDFDEVTEPGSYFITVDDGGKSREFRIGDDVFVEPLQAAMLGMYGLRCGSAVSFEWNGDTFGHGECHTGDEAPGGWHDAGDYGKYTTNGSFSLAMMLVAWDHFREKLEPLEFAIPERGGAIPDFLDECRYQVEWLLAMQDAETGGVYDRLTPYCESCTAMNQPFDPMNTMPEQTTSNRRLAPISTPATADFAAVLARAARAFEPYDAELAQKARDAAVAAWGYLVEHTTPEPPTNVKYTGYYLTGDVDDRLWAAAEIWETTGDAEALAAFEAASVRTGLATNWDWADVQNLGIYTYLLSEREGRDAERVETITTQLLAQGSLLADTAEAHAYGRSLGSTYYWGINGVVARTVMNFTVAERLAGDDEETKARFRAASSFQLDHQLGRNFYGRSFVTGVGYDPPRAPHHRPSVADGNISPWPGLLIGGPSGQGQDGMIVTQAATSWHDEASNYTTNEVAINWNGAFIYALAAFLP